MKKVALLALLLTIALLISLIATGCSGKNATTTSDPGTTTSTPMPGGNGADTERVLRVGTAQTGTGFNPSSQTEGIGNLLVWDRLLRRVGSDTLNWLADCAWVDETTYEVKMHDGIYFNNGNQMTGEDVFYSYQLYASNPGASNAQILSNIDYDKSTVSADKMTVTFKFKNEYGSFEAFIDQIPIMDHTTADWTADDARWWDAPVHSGPYDIEENVSGSHTTFVLRDDYWNKDITLDWDKIILNYYQDTTAMFIAFENGEIDVVCDLASDDVGRVMAGSVANADYKLIPANAACTICFNPDVEYFSDAKVREAIANAIDQDDFGTIQFGVLYQNVDSVLTETCNFYVSTGTYDKGLNYAKKCMAESAYPNGFTINCVGRTDQSPAWDVIRESLAEIGITVNVECYDPMTAIPMWLQGQTDIMLMSVDGGNTPCDPVVSMEQNCDAGQIMPARIMDKEYNEHFKLAAYSNDRKVRAENYAWMQQWLYDNFQVIPVAEQVYAIAWNTDVVGSWDYLSNAIKLDLLFCHAK